jgi:glucose-1-phosphate cytidylyltransferase
MIAVILAGGLGTRMGHETAFRPKPMVEIGPEPTLWHLIRFLEVAGIENFLIAGGYRVEVIFEYFQRNMHKFLDRTKIDVIDTGPETQTGGRLLSLKKYIKNGEDFLCTYGDGLTDLSVNRLLRFHKTHGAIATVTGVKPQSRFGVMKKIALNGEVKEFIEKPLESNYVNGGFFIFKTDIFTYLTADSALESTPMLRLVEDSQLYCFEHEGFWKSMDTYRENRELHQMWIEGNAPWKVW